MPRKGKRRREGQRERRVREQEAPPRAAETNAPKAARPPAAKVRRPDNTRVRRRGAAGPPWQIVGPAAVAALVAVVVGALFATGAMFGGDDSDASPQTSPDPRVGGLPITARFTIEALGEDDSSSFQPREIQSKAGDVIEITLKNSSGVIHNLRVSGPNKVYEEGEPGTGDDFWPTPYAVKPGESGTTLVKIDQPGTYPFRCDFHPTVQFGTLALQ